MKIHNTKQLQIISLLTFALELGYYPRDRSKLSKGFEKVSFDKKVKGNNYISFSDMVRLHNAVIVRVVNTADSEQTRWEMLELSHLNLDWNKYTDALKERFVEAVKLQKCSSEEEGVICQNDLISLTEKGFGIMIEFLSGNVSEV